jgi:8-oxo-dGTP diphosphatase
MNQKISHDNETKAHGQQVITACAFIHQNFEGLEKVFVAKRAGTKKFLPGVYELPGGHIDFGEDISDGLKREIKEEFGMSISVGEPFAVFSYVNEVKGSHSVEIIYFAHFTDSIENIVINPKDHSKFEWIAENEMEKIYTVNKGAGDPEFKVIQRGFSILRGASSDLIG